MFHYNLYGLCFDWGHLCFIQILFFHADYKKHRDSMLMNYLYKLPELVQDLKRDYEQKKNLNQKLQDIESILQFAQNNNKELEVICLSNCLIQDLKRCFKRKPKQSQVCAGKSQSGLLFFQLLLVSLSPFLLFQ